MPQRGEGCATKRQSRQYERNIQHRRQTGESLSLMQEGLERKKLAERPEERGEDRKAELAATVIRSTSGDETSGGRIE